ncbi:MAG: hemerythrin domain-containing protein [Pseudomonadota bacterium]
MSRNLGLELIADSMSFFAAPDGDPLIALERAHDALLTLCDMLEQIADSIPTRICHDTCYRLGRDLLPLIRSIHQFEEDILYPLAVQRLGASKAIESTVIRLRYEHCEDECFAEELSDALQEVGSGKDLKNPEAMGYMLRGFFEVLRRHIAFERDHLLGLMRRAISDGNNGWAPA